MATRTSRYPARGRRPSTSRHRPPSRSRAWLWLATAVPLVVLLALAAVRPGSRSNGTADAGTGSARVDAEGRGTTDVGGQAPAFSVTTLSGATFSFPTGKPTVLFFLAGWCGSCVPEAQALGRIQRDLGDRVAILAVSIDPSETPDTLREFIRAAGSPQYPFAIDAEGTLMRAFNARSLDTTVIAGPTGRIVFRDGIPTGETTLRSAIARAVSA